MNSLSNVVLSIVVARSATPEDFGRWSYGYIGFMMMYSIVRAGCVSPILLRGASALPASHRRGALPVAAGLGAVTAVIVAGTAAFDSRLFNAVWPIAIVMPVLAGVDVVRAIALQSKRNYLAALIDASWLLPQVALFALLIRVGADSPATMTLVWGATGAVSFVAALLALKIRPSFSFGKTFWMTESGQSWKIVADELLIALRTQATPLAVTLFAGFAAAGTLRSGLTLMGVLNTLVLGMTPLATLALARDAALGRTPWSQANRWATLVFALAVTNGLALLAIPVDVGQQLLGDNWAGARSVLVALIIHSCLRGYITAAPLVLRTRGHFDEALRLRTQIEPVALLFPVAGAILAGAHGAAWGYVLGGFASTLQSVRGISISSRKDIRERRSHEDS